eukprot:174982-Alexandrium_andersonii.AAC.1
MITCLRSFCLHACMQVTAKGRRPTAKCHRKRGPRSQVALASRTANRRKNKSEGRTARRRLNHLLASTRGHLKPMGVGPHGSGRHGQGPSDPESNHQDIYSEKNCRCPKKLVSKLPYGTKLKVATLNVKSLMRSTMQRQ